MPDHGISNSVNSKQYRCPLARIIIILSTRSTASSHACWLLICLGSMYTTRRGQTNACTYIGLAYIKSVALLHATKSKLIFLYFDCINKYLADVASVTSSKSFRFHLWTMALWLSWCRIQSGRVSIHWKYISYNTVFSGWISVDHIIISVSHTMKAENRTGLLAASAWMSLRTETLTYESGQELLCWRSVT